MARPSLSPAVWKVSFHGLLLVKPPMTFVHGGGEGGEGGVSECLVQQRSRELVHRCPIQSLAVDAGRGRQGSAAAAMLLDAAERDRD